MRNVFGVNLMNELQQVLLIFAVVVIAGLYFLSRSRQNTVNKKTTQESESHSKSNTQSLNANVASNESKHAHTKPVESHSDALNNLGTPHIPLSESTERRISGGRGYSNAELTQYADAIPEVQDEINLNQGVLPFGDEFELPHQAPNSVQSSQPELVKPAQSTESQSVSSQVESTQQLNPNIEQTGTDDSKPKDGPKHHVLVVDDPGMIGELDEKSIPPDFVKPSFGIPEEETKTKSVKSSTNKAPEVYVLMVMSSAHEFKMTDVNQALLGVGLTYSDQGIFVKKDNMGNAFIKVANMLEPGTFPQENLEAYLTPGVAMILELPTTVRAPAAMHDLIIMARKVSQRLNGRLYNMERQLIKESDLQSMRDAALDYESEPIA